MTNAELINAIRENEECNNCAIWVKDECNERKMSLAAADALEAADKRIAELEAQMPKEGEWLRTDAFPHRIYCSVCYKTYVPNDRWQIWVDDELPKNYCPNCGAKMQTVTDCHTLEEG